MKIKKQGVLYGSFLLLASVAISRIAGLLLKIPLANILGGVGMGYYSSAYTVFMPIYALCAASLPTALAQMVSQSDALGQRHRIFAVKEAAIKFFGGLGLLCTLITIFGAKIISTHIVGNPEAWTSVAVISLSIFLGTLTSIYRGLYEGLCDMTPTAVSQAVDSIAKLIAGLSLATIASKKGLGLPYVSAYAVAGTVIADFVSLLCLMLWKKERKPKPLPDQKELVVCELKRLLRLTAPIALAGLVTSMVSTIDLSTIILLIKSSLKQNPWLYIEKYSDVLKSGVELKELPNFLYGSFTGLAFSIYTLIPSLCSVFGKSTFPKVSQLYAKNNKVAVSKEIRRCICICTYIALPAGFGISLFSKQILNLLFSSKSAEVLVTATPLAILALGTVFTAVSTACCFMLQAIGKQDTPVKITLASAVLKLILNTVLVPIPSLGLTGAAISTVVSGAFGCIWSVVSLYKLTNTKPKILLSTVFPAVLGVFSCILAKFVYMNMPENRLNAWVLLLFSVLIAIIAYALGTFLLDISTKNSVYAQFFEKKT